MIVLKMYTSCSLLTVDINQNMDNACNAPVKFHQFYALVFLLNQWLNFLDQLGNEYNNRSA